MSIRQTLCNLKRKQMKKSCKSHRTEINWCWNILIIQIWTDKSVINKRLNAALTAKWRIIDFSNLMKHKPPVTPVCSSLFSVLWKHLGYSVVFRTLVLSLCSMFLNAAHVGSDWWRCFLYLLVFCFFPGVYADVFRRLKPQNIQFTVTEDK